MDFRSLVRAALVILMLLGSTVSAYSSCYAEDGEEEEWVAEEIAEDSGPGDEWVAEDDPGPAEEPIAEEESGPEEAWAADEPEPADDSVSLDSRSATASYLDQLLAEINARRERAGTGHLHYVMEQANEALSQYLADLTPAMEATGGCFHGGSAGWDYVAQVGFEGDAAGEVIACPGDEGYWTADRIAEAWWSSPMHQSILYRDPSARIIACGTYGPQDGGAAFRTIACVIYRG